MWGKTSIASFIFIGLFDCATAENLDDRSIGPLNVCISHFSGDSTQLPAWRKEPNLDEESVDFMEGYVSPERDLILRLTPAEKSSLFGFPICAMETVTNWHQEVFSALALAKMSDPKKDALLSTTLSETESAIEELPTLTVEPELIGFKSLRQFVGCYQGMRLSAQIGIAKTDSVRISFEHRHLLDGTCQ